METDFSLSRLGWLLAAIFLLPLLNCQSKSDYLEKLQEQLTQIVKQVEPSVVSIIAVDPKTGESKVGGGVSIKPNTILTTETVIGDASQISILLQNGEKIDTSQIESICSDYETNTSFIKLKRNDLKPVTCSESEVGSGSIGIVVGNSLYGQGLDVSYGTLASSWIGGDDPYDEPLLTLRLDLGEHSGGMPVFNHQGQLVGVVEGMIQGEDGLSLVLPAEVCLKVGKAMDESHGSIHRGWIGVFVGRPCPLGTVGEGVEVGNIRPNMIAQLDPDGNAKKAGLKPGDLVLSCQGKEIKNSKDLRQIISMLSPGSRVELVILQEGRHMTKKVQVGEAPKTQTFRRCASRSI